jgi:hypothetical protein
MHRRVLGSLAVFLVVIGLTGCSTGPTSLPVTPAPSTTVGVPADGGKTPVAQARTRAAAAAAPAAAATSAAK